MKNLMLSATTAIMLTLVMLSLASAQLLAGGNENKKIKKNNSSEYAEALDDMAKNLKENDSVFDYEVTPQIKVYDNNYDLVKEAIIPPDSNIEDPELLALIQKSSILLEFENITYYLMND